MTQLSEENVMQGHEIELPSGNKVTFREPRNADRHTVIRTYLDREGKGPGEIELLAAFCLTGINGQQVMEPHPAHRMSNWSTKDVQFYQGVFLEMFFLNGDTDVEKIKDVAKKLMSPSVDAG
jgi:hypothetical protein